MTDFLYHAVAFVVALGVLIVVHEFGHYWVARRLGVKVLRFSVGFGKPLWSRKVGSDRMELVVSALPLGGYVKMLDENEGDVTEAERPRAFNRQPVWKRSAIVLAGPTFNFLFAILAYWLVFMSGTEGIRPVIGQVAKGSIAEQAGFKAGEEIVALDGKEVQSWNQRRLYLFKRALEQRSIEVQVRDSSGQLHARTLDLTAFPVTEVNASLVERGIGLVGYIPEPLPVIGALDPGGPAGRAGLMPEDRILEIDGQSIGSWNELADAIRLRPSKTVTVVVDRDGVQRRFEVTPEAVEHEGATVGRIHIRPKLADVPPEMLVQVRYGVVEALGEAVDNTWSMSWLTLEMLWRMLKLEVSTRNISGPITIAQYAGQSAKIGLEPFVLFLAVISISLGVLNLLPIPVLDGGHLLYYVAEGIRGRPLPDRVLAAGQQVGIALLIGLMLLAFYNDLTRLFN
jgi:regulator of sigma E protease